MKINPLKEIAGTVEAVRTAVSASREYRDGARQRLRRLAVTAR